MSTTPAALKELREVVRQKISAALPALVDEYFLNLRTDGDVEDYRKALALLFESTGMRESAQKDPYGNLPMFNFNLAAGRAGRLTIKSTSPSGQQTLDIDLQPTPEMLQFVDVNEDLALDD